MNTEFEEENPGVDEDQIDTVDEEELAETAVLVETMPTDNVGDVSVEINVEQLIADIEGASDEDAAKKKAVRRKLEDLAEDQSFEDTYAIEFDEV